MENTSDSFMPRPLLFCLKSGRSVCYSVPDNRKTIGVDLQVTTLLGWFVLASLLINEIRSILENFVEAGLNVPVVLIKGLEVADKLVNKDDNTK